MYHKIFIVLIVVVAFVAAIAGAITPPVIGQQNQASNLTALLTQAPSNNDTTSEAPANITANNDTTTTGTTANNNTIANVDAPDNMTIEEAKDLYLSVWNQTEFNGTFSTFVEPFSAAGYGVYEERNNTFTPGETIVLYVEPVGFGHEQVIDERDFNSNNSNTTILYLMNMTADYEIAAANGTGLQLIEDVEVLRNITSHRPNTEMFLTLTITPNVQPLPIGSYVITYSVNDEVSGESFQLKKEIIIAARER